MPILGQAQGSRCSVITQPPSEDHIRKEARSRSRQPITLMSTGSPWFVSSSCGSWNPLR